MQHRLWKALAIVSLFIAGMIGGLAFTDVQPEAVCEGTYVQEFFHYSETSDGVGYESTQDAVSAETLAMNANAPVYSVQQVDPAAGAGGDQWVVSTDVGNVAAFTVHRSESGRYVVGSRLACVEDDGLTPVDKNLDLSAMTDFQDFTTYVTEEEWQAQHEKDGA